MARSLPSTHTGRLLTAVLVAVACSAGDGTARAAAYTLPTSNLPVASSKSWPHNSFYNFHGGHRHGAILIIHAGGWYIGATPDVLAGLAKPFVDAGFDVAAVDYPLRNYQAALDACHAALDHLNKMEGHLPVFIYGESAGANMTVQLDTAGAVAGAVAVAGPLDLVQWMSGTNYYRSVLPLTMSQRIRASPVRRNVTFGPLLLEHSPWDDVVPFDESQRMAAKTHSRLIRLHGHHLQDGACVTNAITWFKGNAATLGR